MGLRPQNRVVSASARPMATGEFVAAVFVPGTLGSGEKLGFRVGQDDPEPGKLAIGQQGSGYGERFGDVPRSDARAEVRPMDLECLADGSRDRMCGVMRNQVRRNSPAPSTAKRCSK